MIRRRYSRVAGWFVRIHYKLEMDVGLSEEGKKLFQGVSLDNEAAGKEGCHLRVVAVGCVLDPVDLRSLPNMRLWSIFFGWAEFGGMYR
jgi:hypothetical protein